jgi:hypothetical protein
MYAVELVGCILEHPECGQGLVVEEGKQIQQFGKDPQLMTDKWIQCLGQFDEGERRIAVGIEELFDGVGTGENICVGIEFLHAVLMPGLDQ